MIKYQYALTSNGDLINIQDLERSSLDKSAKFYSVDFKQELIPRLGEIRVKHFSHKSNITILGNSETYFHALGKRVFFEEYSKCLKTKTSYNFLYYIHKYCNRLQKEYDTLCCLQSESHLFDLTKYYEDIIMERVHDKFIPDLLLRNPKTNQVIYIEIAVTHKSSQEKKNSGIRIIEFIIENERDIQQIIEFGKNGKSRNASVYNFKEKTEKGSFCSEGKCINKFNLFSINENGKCNLAVLNENEIREATERNTKSVVWNLVEKYDYKDYEELYSENRIHRDLFVNYIARAYKKGKDVKNCYACRYHGEASNWEYCTKNPIFCKFQKIKCNSDNAITCQYYRIEESYIREYLKPLYIY